MAGIPVKGGVGSLGEVSAHKKKKRELRSCVFSSLTKGGHC
jgi:hypothetical protein